MTAVDRYLTTNYRPDKDYLDGQLVERLWGELKHGIAQGGTAAWLNSRRRHWRIVPAISVRIKINEHRYRVADVVAISAAAPDQEILLTPPVLCVEIASRRDTFIGMWQRIDDYLAIGVPVCWIIDPEARCAWTVTPAGLVEAKDGILRAGEIEMPLAEVLE
jgi:Uma2 family endonuclease